MSHVHPSRSRALERRITATLLTGMGLFVGCREPTTTPTIANGVSAPEQVRDLVGLGGYWAMAEGINDFGRVVGAASDVRGRSRGFSWSELGGVRDLGTLGGNFAA